jgi:hypothetical protein
MPLMDHHHPPLDMLLGWTSLHAAWATHLTDDLDTRWLSQEYLATEHVRFGNRFAIDIGTAEPPPQAARTVPTFFPDSVEVEVGSTAYGGNHLVAVVKIASPTDQVGPADRRAFAAKCAAYLQRGISLAVIDTVTSHRCNLHNELMRLMEATPELLRPSDEFLYAVSYRPVVRDRKSELDIWYAPLRLGEPIPTMPLRLMADLFVPLEFEDTYMETCRRRRLL